MNNEKQAIIFLLNFRQEMISKISRNLVFLTHSRERMGTYHKLS